MSYRALLIDLTGTFDCLQDEQLIDTIHAYGVDVILLKLIHSYFLKKAIPYGKLMLYVLITLQCSMRPLCECSFKLWIKEVFQLLGWKDIKACPQKPDKFSWWLGSQRKFKLPTVNSKLPKLSIEIWSGCK